MMSPVDVTIRKKSLVVLTSDSKMIIADANPITNAATKPESGSLRTLDTRVLLSFVPRSESAF